jgi:hypothetical protein
MARIADNSRNSRTSRRIARTLGLALGAAGACVLAGQATALPLDNDLPNIQIPPQAAITATPNPVVVPRPFVVAPGEVGPIQAIQLGALVTFNAGASFDLNGTIVKYEWDLDGAPGFEKTTATPGTTRRYLQNGSVIVKVRVTDNQGLKDTASVQLVRHYAPIARATVSAAVPLAGDGVTFDGSGSSDDGSIVKYEWDLDGDGTFERTGVQAATSFGAPGPRTATLRVTDNHGVARTGTVALRVNERPTAAFTSTPLVPVAGAPATFDASASSDDTGIAKYEWDLDGNGSFETDTQATPTTQTTFTTPGPATVRLKVTDTDGATDTTQLTFQVAEPGAAVQADTTAPRLVPRSRVLKMTASGQVRVRLTCPATEQTCRVNIRLAGVKPLSGKRLGGRTITMPGGRTMNIAVQLTKAARTSVRTRGVIRARAIITATDQSGNRSVTRTPVRIRR